MAQKHYPDVDPNPNFAQLEEQVLQFWNEHRIFEQSVEQRPHGGGNDYVFYDGPPFANGLPHYGHLLTGYVKDAVARYQTMRGKRVERRFGWDCHGLPAEMGAEKELNITGRAAIIEYGIGKFNDYCRTNVMRYVADWEYYVSRQGRWVDFANDYKTMDKNFMESVIWAFSELHKKGLVYEAFRVMPYSWAAETPLSNFETRMDNATREREDKAAYVKFKLKERLDVASDCDLYIVAWTTTPWTLPSNLALAVNSEMGYKARVGQDGNCYIYAVASEEKIKDALKFIDAPALTMLGKELVGKEYEPLFPYFADTKNAFRVIDGGEAVTEGEGTGVIHMAPGFGEVDQKICAQNEIEVIVPVDGQGKFTDAIYDLCSPLAGEPNRSSRFGGGRDALLTQHARQMRKEPTPWEAKLWNLLKQEQLGNYKFRRQESIDHYIADFVNYEKRLVVELDGSQHAEATSEYDRARDEYLRAAGFTVLRFWNNELDVNPQGVLQKILETLDSLPPHGFASANPAPPQGGSNERRLTLRGLNVIADTRVEESDLEGMDPRKVERFKEHVKKYGLANMRIIRWLDDHGQLVKQEEIKHNYPHCWRTDTPIIYRAMSSWYVAVTKFRDRAVELNQQINWIPEHVKNGQMGHMLATAPDWSISRNRFWGTPIPIWRAPSGKVMVPDSIEQIEQWSGQKVPDLHRPYIDEVTFEKDGEIYTRVEDVFDCWFESGSMPYAQMHYMGEKTKDPAVKKKFEENFPADFITEYVGQTRGWFNTMIMLSTALFDKPPFENCICHGVVIDEESGLKYSKRLKNYKDPKEVMDVYGADALRWMMLASPVMRGADIGVDPEGKFIRDVVRLNIKPLWSAYNFFTLYANADGIKAEEITTSENTLDRYILAKAKAAVTQVRTSMDAYDTPGATDAITGFFDVLNNWYIRRSRARFWDEEVTVDKTAAFNTLYTVLNLMVKAAAPLLPFTVEMVYRGLNGEANSVHLHDFPDVSGIDSAEALIADMDRVRDACTAMGSIRSTENIRNRQPLASATLYGAGADRLKPFAELMQDELNIKEIRFSNTLEGVAEYTLTVDFKVAGKRLGPKMKAVGAAAKAGDWRREGDQVIVGGEPMEAGEYNLLLKPLINKGAQALPGNNALVVLDLTITPELEAEGRARDLVRMIQQARKDAGLNVADRITLALDIPAEFHSALATHKEYIANQVLAVSIGEGAAQADTQLTQELDGAQFVIGISKAA